jgi:pyruvate kinase
MKRTKIICTIGPACDNEKTLSEMIRAGMNIARLNFSHGTHEEHQQKIDLIKKVRADLGEPIPIMLDTKGPEYRIKTFKNHKVTLKEGDTFAFTAEDIEGDEHRVSVSYTNMVNELKPGDRVLINNGLVVMEVTGRADHELLCKVIYGGELSDRKSMSFPNKVLNQVYLSEQDKDDLLFGIQNDVDFVAASFVSRAQDVVDVRRFLDANGGKDIDIIAKIENRHGVDNIEKIIEVADGIMVARGDMGVEIPYEQLPGIQKMLINTCRLKGKRVITATEMLESMITNPRPTRAEISDVANAVYDGTSCVMLSGETAAGKFPVRAVEAMSRIAEEAEGNINYAERFHRLPFEIKSANDAISHATCELSIDTDAKVVVVCTRSGATARMVSRFRTPKPIIGLTSCEKTWRQLAMSWAVTPMLCDEYYSIDVLFYHAVKAALKSGMAKKGDQLVVTGGMTNGESGNTNLIKLETV